ncbi:hypothetical protein ACSSVY_001957 [Roseovarius sp. MBR-51]
MSTSRTRLGFRSRFLDLLGCACIVQAFRTTFFRSSKMLHYVRTTVLVTNATSI